MLPVIDLSGFCAKHLEWCQMLTRTLIFFVTAPAFIRIQGMDTFGASSAFIVVVAISLAAIPGKSIMGHYPFFPGLLAANFLVCRQRLTACLAAHSELFFQDNERRYYCDTQGSRGTGTQDAHLLFTFFERQASRLLKTIKAH